MSDTGQHYVIELDDNRFQETSSRVKHTFNSIGDTAAQEGSRMDDSFRKMAAAAAGFFTLKQAADFARKMVQVRAEVESLEISFRTLVGNKDKADALFASIREFAANTPMMLNGLAKGAQTLLSFNVEADKVMGILKQIGDISMGDQQKFDSLTLAFAQMSATGKLMGQDLLQMINAGFNPLAVMSEKTGKSISQLKDEMSAGAISSQMVAQAFADATAEGGKFHDMLLKQSKGLNGSISNLKGAIDDMFNDIGTKSQGTVSEIVQGTTEIVRNYKKVGDALAVLITAYGSYKAAVIATNLVMKAQAFADNIRLIGMFRKELGLLKAAQQAFNITAASNPYILAATAIITATVAIGRLIKRKREEEQAIIDSTKEMRNEYTQTNLLIGKLKDANLKEEERRKILEQLREVNPDIVKDIKDEATAYEQLNARLEEYNKRQLAAIAVKQFSKREDFDEAVEDLTEARDKLEGVSADMINTWATIYDRYLKMVESGEEIPTKVRSLMDSLVESSAPESEKVEAVLSAWRDMRKRIEKSSGSYQGWADGRQQLYNLIVGIDDDDFKSAQKKLDKLQSVYEEKAQALKAKIETIAASIYTTDDKARQEFIDSQMALYFPETVKKPEIGGDNDNLIIKSIKEQTQEAIAEVERLKQEIADLRSGKTTTDANNNVIKDFAAEIAAREKALKEAQERVATLTGIKDKSNNNQANNQAAEADKMRRQIEKEARELQRLQEDLDLEAQQAHAETLADGFAKDEELRQIAHEREMLQLERNREDYLTKLQEAERSEWEAAHPDWKDKRLTFTPTVTELPSDIKERFDAIERAMTQSFNQANQKALEEALNDYLTFEQRKTKVHERYERERQALVNPDGTLRDGVTQGNMDVLARKEKEEIEAINREMRSVEDSASRMFQNVFGNVSKKTKEQILEAINYAKAKLAELGDDADPKDVETWVNQIEALEDELMNRKFGGAASTDWTTIVTNFAKILEYRKRLANASEEERESIEGSIRALQDMNRKNLLAAGGLTFANALSKAASTMREIAQITSDTDMGKYAEGLSMAADALSSAAQGFASGGWIGALVGAATSIVGSIVNAVAETEVAMAKLEVAGQKYEDAIALLNVTFKDAESVFGSLDIGNLGGLVRNLSRLNQQLIAAKQNYSSLFPQHYGQHDGYNGLWRALRSAEELQAWLDAYSGSYSSAQIQWVQNYLNILREIENETEELNGILSNYLGSIADQLTDAIFEGVENGSSAWDIFEKDAAAVIKNIGKQMLKEIIISEYLNNFTDQLKEAFATGDPEEIVAIMGTMITGLGGKMDEYREWVEAYYQLMHDAGIDPYGEREGLSKGISVSQDSIDEVNGRATVIQGHTFIMAENSISIAESMQAVKGIAAEILNHIAGIHDNTQSVVVKIDDIQTEMSNLKSTLNDIAVKGIKIK